MRQGSPGENSAELARVMTLVRRSYRLLLHSCASPGIDVLWIVEFLSRPLKRTPQADAALSLPHRLPQKRMSGPPARGAVPGAEAPGTADAQLAEPGVVGLVGPLVDLPARGVECDPVALLHPAGELVT